MSIVCFLFLLPGFAWGQQTGTTNQTRRAWPAPVRNASHTEMHIGETGNSAGEVITQGFFSGSPYNALRGPSPPHQVLQAPDQASASNHRLGGKPLGLGKNIEKKRATHPPHSNYVRRFQPAPAVIPGAAEQTQWKTPYSYGYFGASSTRHWSMHHGHRDRYTEWRLK